MRHHYYLFLSVLLSLCISFSSPVHAKRLALVIGNNDYTNVPKLEKAVNDATAIALTLEDTGFQVILKNNVDTQKMDQLLRQLAAKIQAGDEVLFYFAGHGIEIRGRNYLLPTNIPPAEPGQEKHVIKASFEVNKIIRLMQDRGSRINILILDACRDNPFARNDNEGIGANRGLGRRKPPKSTKRHFVSGGKVQPSGTFLMYSAGINQAALDRLNNQDNDPNSVYTRKLLPLLKTKGLPINRLARQLRSEVEELAATEKYDQFPGYYDQIRGDYFIVPGKLKTSKTAIETNPDIVLWNTINGSKKPSDYEFYLSTYPKGIYAAVAKLKLQQLAALQLPDKSSLATKKRTDTPSYKPGMNFKDCPQCPQMTVVPAGEFIMGLPKSQLSVLGREGPRHRVTIPWNFAVGSFEITRKQFETFVKETGHNTGFECTTLESWMLKAKLGRSIRNPGFKQKASHPVVCVSWQDAKAYIKWLKEVTGQPYRLLTEAEWEYVARATSNTTYSFGDNGNRLCSYGNIFDQTLLKKIKSDDPDIAKCNDKYANTAPIGTYAPNKFGLYDLHGNVAEWVEDCWHNDYRGAPIDGSAWRENTDCSLRVIRGGSWLSNISFVKSAIRSPDAAISYTATTGFRVARDIK